MTMHTKVAGVWEDVDDPSVKVAGVWQPVQEGLVKVAGTWEQFYLRQNIPTTLVAFFSIALPAGTQLCDGTAGTPNMNGCYVVGGNAEGTATGSDTHTPSNTVVGTFGYTALNREGTVVSNVMVNITHTHTVGSHGHGGAVDHKPLGNDGKAAQMTGGITKAGMIMFNTVAVAPTGWSHVSLLSGRYIRATNTGTGGSVGASSHSHGGNSTGTGEHNERRSWNNSGASNQKMWVHSHTQSHTMQSKSNNPRHIDLYPVSCDADGNDVVSGMVAFFVGSVVPTGWTLYAAAQGVLIRCNSTVNTTPSGSDTHTDTSNSTTTNAQNPIGNRISTGANCARPASHSHGVPSHNHGTHTSLPRRITLLVCSKD